MSLDYVYLFNEIDKAKKKKYVPWNSPESKKLQEAHAKETKEQKESGNVSQPFYVDGKETDSRNKPFRGYTKKPAKTSTNQEDIPVTSSTVSDIPKPKGEEAKRRESNQVIDDKMREDKKRLQDERDRVQRVRSELQERAAQRREAKEEKKRKQIAAEHKKRRAEDGKEKKVRVGGGQKKERGNLQFEFGSAGTATRDDREEQRKTREEQTVTETATVAGKKREFKRPKTHNEIVAENIKRVGQTEFAADTKRRHAEIDREQQGVADTQAKEQGMEGMTDLERQEAEVKQFKAGEKKRRDAATHWGIGTKKKPKKTEAQQDQDAKNLKDEVEHYVQTEADKLAKEKEDGDTKKSLWKSWLKDKDALTGEGTDKIIAGTSIRRRRGTKEQTSQGQATDARHLDSPSGASGDSARERFHSEIGDITDRPHPDKTDSYYRSDRHDKTPPKKRGGKRVAATPQGHGLKYGITPAGNKYGRKKPFEDKPQDWKKIDDAVQAERAKELEARAGKGIPYGKSLWKAWLKIKAEEGMGGMNMGAQRGLGHEAGYKQDSGQSTQITEVKEEEESKKSAYETYEQNETPETEPNKRQIPHSKPKTDTFKSLYKKALIIKYKNIYKPLNT